MFYMCTILKYLEYRITYRIQSYDQHFGTFPGHQPAKKVYNIIIMNANIKTKEYITK